MNKLEEINYPDYLINKITPYLDNIKYRDKANKNRKLPLKHKCFAWYYVHNGGNSADAYKRSHYSKFSDKKNKLLFRKHIKQDSIYTGGSRLFRNVLVKEMIRRIREDLQAKIKEDIPQSMLEQLQIQATYDPSLFIHTDGRPAFNTWEEIPVKYRCCVESISTTRYGKDGKLIETNLKLVDRSKARMELMKIAPDLLQPTKLELIHKTVDECGNETGIDFSKLSDYKLREILKENN